MDFIRLGDKTTGDGEVISASETMGYDGRKLVRKGGRVTPRSAKAFFDT